MTDMKGNSITITIDRAEFKEIISELRRMARALAVSRIRSEAGTEKNARFLRVFEFSEQEIADLLGVSQQAVNKALNKKVKERSRSE